ISVAPKTYHFAFDLIFERMQPLNCWTLLVDVFSGPRRIIFYHKSQNRDSSLNSVIVFPLCVRNGTGERAVPVRDDHYVVITLINLPLYKLPLLFVSRTKHLHSYRNVAQLQNCFRHSVPLAPKITLCGADEYLIFLFHEN